MRFLIRRVYAASVECAESTVGQIANGLVVYLGVANDDEITDIEWGVKKILGIRIFEDKSGKMNLPISEKMGILVISQFTLFGNLKKGYLFVQYHLIWHVPCMICRNLEFFRGSWTGIWCSYENLLLRPPLSIAVLKIVLLWKVM